MNEVKHNTYDSVFKLLFCSPDKENLLQLYHALHPEDTDVTTDGLKLLTIENAFMNGVYNDLGFMVRDRLIILVEAQSTWSPNILIRLFIYLAHTYQDYIYGNNFLNGQLFSGKKLSLPLSELFVIYTGPKASKPDTMSLYEEFFASSGSDVYGNSSSLRPIDLTARIIYANDISDDIISQYISFCTILKDEYSHASDKKGAIRNAISICIQNGILTEFLTERRMEVEEMSMLLLSQEEIIYYSKEYEKNEARKEGRAEERTKAIIKMCNKGMTTEQILDLDYSQEEIDRAIQLLKNQ